MLVRNVHVVSIIAEDRFVICDTLPVKCHRADYPGARENSDGKVTRPQIDDSGEVRLRHRPLRMILNPHIVFARISHMHEITKYFLFY